MYKVGLETILVDGYLPEDRKQAVLYILNNVLEIDYEIFDWDDIIDEKLIVISLLDYYTHYGRLGSFCSPIILEITDGVPIEVQNHPWEVFEVLEDTALSDPSEKRVIVILKKKCKEDKGFSVICGYTNRHQYYTSIDFGWDSFDVLNPFSVIDIELEFQGLHCLEKSSLLILHDYLKFLNKAGVVNDNQLTSYEEILLNH